MSVTWAVLFAIWISGLQAAIPESLGADWNAHGGQWQAANQNPLVLWQSAGTGMASVAPPPLPGPGNVWRCTVEPGAQTEAAGIYFGASRDFKQRYVLMLGGVAEQGLALCDAGGNVLWRDAYPVMAYYTPVVLEGIVEPGRVRVQALKWDREAVLAQSDWIPVPDVAPEERLGFALFSNNGQARFWSWERGEQPLSEILPDSPSKMRLASDGADEWAILGGGDWRWLSPDKDGLRQGAVVERSTAIKRNTGGPEGVWRCRISVSPGAGGAGLIVLTDDKLRCGFSAWLGGEFGNGALMLYRLPGEALWSSEQGKWHYDIEYVVECAVKEGMITARMFEKDGRSVIAESPAMPLTEEEKVKPGFTGFQTWKGMASFCDFSDASLSTKAGDSSVLPSTPLGAGWNVFEGGWRLGGVNEKVLLHDTGNGIATAVNTEMSASKGTYSAVIRPGQSTTRVSLLFQASADGKEGFECRLEKGVSLRSLDGRTLWEKPEFLWETGRSYRVEGIVVADRVRISIGDETGKMLIQSEECYVSDRNNARKGHLGFRLEGGAAQFAQWNVQASE